jgi:integrase
MVEGKEKYLMKYCEYLGSTGMSYDTRGKYMDVVCFFLNRANEAGKRGYLSFCKQYSEYLVQYPWAKPALLHYLASRGLGYREVPKAKQKPVLEAIEKREKRQNETINDFAYWLQNEHHFSESTLSVYTEGAKSFYSYFDELTQDNCVRYVAQLEKNGAKPGTVRLRITALLHLAKFLKKQIKINPPKIQRTLHTENVPTENEYRMLVKWLDQNNPHYAFIIRLMATTGCRVSELLQFRYEDIWVGHVELKGKGNKYRSFFFTRELQNAAKGLSGTVCTNHYGLPISSRGLSQQLKALGLKVGIDQSKMHPHAFRHFFAKMYLQKTKDVVGLAELLGHASVDTTRIYLQKSYDEQKREFNRAVTW